PRLRRHWHSGVERALRGREARLAARDYAFEEWTFTVLPYDAAERALLVDRLEAALRAGKAAVPRWGFGERLAAASLPPAGGITVEREDHGIPEGGRGILHHWDPARHEDWEAVEVASVDGTVLGVTPDLELEFA